MYTAIFRPFVGLKIPGQEIHEVQGGGQEVGVMVDQSQKN